MARGQKRRCRETDCLLKPRHQGMHKALDGHGMPLFWIMDEMDGLAALREDG